MLTLESNIWILQLPKHWTIQKHQSRNETNFIEKDRRDMTQISEEQTRHPVEASTTEKGEMKLNAQLCLFNHSKPLKLK